MQMHRSSIFWNERVKILLAQWLIHIDSQNIEQ